MLNGDKVNRVDNFKQILNTGLVKMKWKIVIALGSGEQCVCVYSQLRAEEFMELEKP